MMYPLSATSSIQTDNILKMGISGSTYTVTMNDAAVTVFTVTASQYSDIIACVNQNHA